MLPERPAKIHVAGFVAATDTENESFLVIVWQKISGVPPLCPLTIRAILREHDGLGHHCPPTSIPPQNIIVAFSGHVLGFEEGVLFVAVYTTSFYLGIGDDNHASSDEEGEETEE